MILSPSIYWILLIVLMLLGGVVQMMVQSRFKKYSQEPLASGLTGYEVALKMLRDNGIHNVQVVPTNGILTDHYDPRDRTIRLSEAVFNSNSVAAAAVAAHETGHAIQHYYQYAPLTMRSALVPIVNFSSNIVQWVLLVGILMIKVFPSLLLIGIVLFAFTTLFSIITLPVEIDASRRALVWLQRSGITTTQQYPMAASALRSAAYTYVVAAVSSLVTLLYYLSIYMNRK